MKIDNVIQICHFCKYFSTGTNAIVGYCGRKSIDNSELMTNDPYKNDCPLPDATTEQIDYFIAFHNMHDEWAKKIYSKKS